MTQQEAVHSVGDVADRTGLTIDTLRFYEREGLLATDIRRASSGRREYTGLVREGDGNEQARLDVLRAHEARIHAQREALDRCLDLVRFKIGVYEDILDM